MRARLQDPDLARLFENTFPNTLGAYSTAVDPVSSNSGVDTTVKYFDPEQNLAFIITGVSIYTFIPLLAAILTVL